jgi:hypothetical protein
MAVNTNVQNAKAVIDALADSKDRTVTGPVALNIAEEFIDDVGGSDENEVKAGKMLDMLFNIIRGTGMSHVRTAADNSHDAAVEAAADAAHSNF